MVLGSTSSRDNRWDEVTFKECPLAGTIYLADRGRWYRINPWGMNSSVLHWAVGEVIVSIGELVVLVQTVVGEGTIRAEKVCLHQNPDQP